MSSFNCGTGDSGVRGKDDTKAAVLNTCITVCSIRRVQFIANADTQHIVYRRLRPEGNSPVTDPSDGRIFDIILHDDWYELNKNSRVRGHVRTKKPVGRFEKHESGKQAGNKAHIRTKVKVTRQTEHLLLFPRISDLPILYIGTNN